MKTLNRAVFAIIAISVLAAASAFADDPPAASGQTAASDPPSRAVRLNYTSGQVSVQPGGVNDWVAADTNRPLTTADRVWTDKESRAELQLGTAVIRMNAETSLTLSNVADNNVQLELDQGTLNLRVVKLYDGEVYEVDTPNLAFTVTKAGDYRFDVDSNNVTTRVTVWKGQGEATGDGPGITLHAREQMEFSDAKSLAHSGTTVPILDGFDDWCRVRDERMDKSLSARYVSPDVPGYEDLDQYGRWEETPAYGPVWVPTVVPGWAPYRFGHWVWIAPWGWTWVDDAPWGYAPFHYGRWVFYSGYWGWCPGPRFYRPIYAPALVAWIGGPRFGVGLSFGIGGGVGWIPLGFGEPFVPWYRGSRVYFEHVNFANTRIRDIRVFSRNYYRGANMDHFAFANRNFATAVPHDAFVNARSVNRSMVRMSPEQIHEASFARNPGVAPGAHSVLGAHAGMPAAAPRAAFNHPVVTRMTPPQRPSTFNGPREMQEARNVGRPGNLVPRPPDRGMQSNMHGPDARTANAHNVPRPPENMNWGGNQGSMHNNANMNRGPANNERSVAPNTERVARNEANPNGSRPVPRPSESVQRGNQGQNRVERSNGGGHSNGNQGHGGQPHNNEQKSNSRASYAYPRPSDDAMARMRSESPRVRSANYGYSNESPSAYLSRSSYGNSGWNSRFYGSYSSPRYSSPSYSNNRGYSSYSRGGYSGGYSNASRGYSNASRGYSGGSSRSSSGGGSRGYSGGSMSAHSSSHSGGGHRG